MKKFFITLIALLFVVSVKTNSFADAFDTNSSTGYSAYIIDNANYLTDAEEDELLERMMQVTTYTNIIYLTSEDNTFGTMSFSSSYANSVLDSLVADGRPGVCYLCDNEYDYISAKGPARKVINSSKCSSIADNVYRLSADERYCDAAIKACKQIYSLYKGDDIPQPMLYICTAFISLFLALLINFSYVNKKSAVTRATQLEMVMGSLRKINTDNFNITLTNTTRVYSPPSSSSSGGHSGGHHSGGGHHGGGHSGGGHSH